ncbi:hypothetical protein ACSCBZ_24705 [Streptomyces niveiscabiei]|uniref:hypothetical protein n=1 Tax=Streptomyces niveiscabiei TaxID=164115 RepID=UPI0006EB715B|nr:hypothetical protein [Streptomyces niveiscabiei]
MTAASLPTPITTTRHQCPHCRRTWAKKAAAATHIARCWCNPDARGCKTCHHLAPAENGPYPEHPGWPQDCTADHDITNSLRANCPSWQPNTA